MMTLSPNEIETRKSCLFFSAQRWLEHLREFSVKFRRLRKIIGNPRKTLGRFRNSRDHGKATISRI